MSSVVIHRSAHAVMRTSPFADPAAAAKAGFDASKPYRFRSFTPAPPNPLGAFHFIRGLNPGTASDDRSARSWPDVRP